MKRFLAALLGLMLFVTPALCEGIDLSGYSVEELWALQKQISDELAERSKAQGMTGYNGVLIGGENIEPGSYELEIYEKALIQVWPTKDMYNSHESPAYGKFSCPGQNVLVSITDGTVVEIGSGSIGIQPSTEDWVPKAE